MTGTRNTQILDLRHATARQMRPLLEAEADLWERTLRWNYRSATELLLEYLNNRILPGFIAITEGRVDGYAFGVYEGHKAVVGDAFSLPAFDRAPGEEGHDPTLDLLLTSLVGLLRASPGIERIESQLLLYPAGSLDSFFRQERFAVYPRFFMECDLTGATGSVYRQFETRRLAHAPQTLGTRLVLRRWAATDFQAAAELIHLAYGDHVDSRINDQYRTLHGSLRFLHNIVRFPGCGVFEATHSWVLEDRVSGLLAGILLCSRVADDVAHVTQLCIAPTHRSLGLGAYLLAYASAQLRHAGQTAISLTVTEENLQAVTLYKQAGFHVRQRFDATVLDLNSQD